MYTVVMCHSFARCEEISEFCKELVSFCPEMLEVLSLEATDINEALAQLKLAKQKSRLVISTPSIIQGLMNQGFFDADKKRSVLNLIVDKVDLCLAMDYSEELKDIATLAKSMPI